MSSERSGRAVSADGRIEAHIVRTGHDRWGGQVAVDGRITKMADGSTEGKSLNEIAAALVEFEQNPPEGMPPRKPSGLPLEISEDERRRWLGRARDARLERELTLRDLTRAINAQAPGLGKPVSISEVSAWYRGALPLPERAIVEAWAGVLGIEMPG